MHSASPTSIEWSEWARFSDEARSRARAIAIATQMAAGWRLRWTPCARLPWVLEFHPFNGQPAEEIEWP